MTLREILAQNDWNDQIYSDFIKGLRRSPNSWTKVQNCKFMALKLAESGDIYRIEKALELINYAQNNIQSGNAEEKAELSMAKGIVLEKGFKDYRAAYEAYSEWAKQDSIIKGHADVRLRTLILADNFEYSEQLETLFYEVSNEQTLNFRSRRFYFYLAKVIIAKKHGDIKTMKITAKEALDISGESGKSLLQMMFSRHHLHDEFEAPESATKYLSRILR